MPISSISNGKVSHSPALPPSIATPAAAEIPASVAALAPPIDTFEPPAATAPAAATEAPAKTPVKGQKKAIEGKFRIWAQGLWDKFTKLLGRSNH